MSKWRVWTTRKWQWPEQDLEIWTASAFQLEALMTQWQMMKTTWWRYLSDLCSCASFMTWANEARQVQGILTVWTLSYHFVCLLCPIMRQFSKNNVFQKLGANFVFCFKLPCLLKHYKKGVQHVFVFLLFNEKKKGKLITGISGFRMILSKNGRCVTVNCFSRIGLVTP